MDFRKEAKASRDKKLHQLTVKAPDAKVDASGFKPYANPELDKKTGKRPVNPRAFKRGGKVTALDGDKAAKRGDRMGAKGRKGKMLGGDITAGGNPQIPSSKGQTSLLRKAVGLDYEKGGRIKKAYGGRGVGERTQTEESRRAAVKAGEDYGVDSRVSEDDLRKATRDYEQKKTETGYKKGGRAKKMDGGPMMAGPAQTLMKRKTPLNNPAAKAPMVAPMRAKGGKVHDDEAEDKALIKKMVKPEARKEKMCGGRTKKADGGNLGAYQTAMDEYLATPRADRKAARGKLADANKAYNQSVADDKSRPQASRDLATMRLGNKNGGRAKRATGGRAKGKSNINIVIAPQPAAQPGMPMGMPPRPMMPPPPPPPAGGAPGGMPPGAMGAGFMPMAMPVPVSMGGGAPAPQGAGVPGIPGMAPLPRKSGGRIKSYKDMDAGAGSGKGRLEKEDMAEYKRTARKAGGKIPMSAGAGSGPGRIEKVHAYGDNPHGNAAPKPKKRSWTM